MDYREDVKKIGEEILGKLLTEDELNECTQAMEDYFTLLLEDCVDEEAALDLFNETFYDQLKDILSN